MDPVHILEGLVSKLLKYNDIIAKCNNTNDDSAKDDDDHAASHQPQRKRKQSPVNGRGEAAFPDTLLTSSFNWINIFQATDDTTQPFYKSNKDKISSQLVDFVSYTAFAIWTSSRDDIAQFTRQIASTSSTNVSKQQFSLKFPRANNFSYSGTFRKYVNRLLEATDLNPTVIFISLWYLYVLKVRSPVPVMPSAGSEYRVVTVALILGHTFLDDHTFTTAAWSKICKIFAPKEIVSMKMEFLRSVEHRLSIPGKEFGKWLRILSSWADVWGAERAQEVKLNMATMKRPRAPSIPASFTFSKPAGAPSLSISIPSPGPIPQQQPNNSSNAMLLDSPGPSSAAARHRRLSVNTAASSTTPTNLRAPRLSIHALSPNPLISPMPLPTPSVLPSPFANTAFYFGAVASGFGQPQQFDNGIHLFDATNLPNDVWNGIWGTKLTREMLEMSMPMEPLRSSFCDITADTTSTPPTAIATNNMNLNMMNMSMNMNMMNMDHAPVFGVPSFIDKTGGRSSMDMEMFRLAGMPTTIPNNANTNNKRPNDARK